MFVLYDGNPAFRDGDDPRRPALDDVLGWTARSAGQAAVKLLAVPVSRFQVHRAVKDLADDFDRPAVGAHCGTRDFLDVGFLETRRTAFQWIRGVRIQYGQMCHAVRLSVLADELFTARAEHLATRAARLGFDYDTVAAVFIAIDRHAIEVGLAVGASG